MKQRLLRVLLWLTTALATGTLVQAACTGANNAYITLPRLTEEGVLTSIDFCYIFDCQSGFFGGAVQPCGDPSTTADDLLVDCPGFFGTTNDQTTP
jgi:hypothetical protein